MKVRLPVLTTSCGHSCGGYASYWNAFFFSGLQMTDIDLDARVTTLEENDNGKDK